MGSVIYSLVWVLLDVIVTSHGDQAKLQAEVLVLRRQVQVLERQIKRVRWSSGDRMDMAALRERIPGSVWAGLLVKPETVLGWHRALVRRKWAASRHLPRRGRPTISAESRQLILRMARENPRWGYFRIRGGLLKLGRAVAATTIRSVLLGAGIPPAGRRSELTWKQFLAAHAQTLVAADFFSVDTVFFKRLYVLIYMHLATRQVLSASCTDRPSEAWVTQQARNLSWKLEEEGIQLGAVVHDRDKRFAPEADAVLRSGGVRVILTPLMAPRANVYAERWIGSCRRECLDWMLVASQRHLETILGEYCAHYNQVGTLFSVFQPDITKADLTPIGPLVVALIERELQLEDLPLDTFGSLRSKELQIAKTADRSVLGCMNEMAFASRMEVSMRGGLARVDLVDLNRRLRRDMHSPRAYARPIDLTAALVGRTVATTTLHLVSRRDF